MGMVLSCPRDALPGEAAAFLILDYELRVSAVSEAGERYFGKEETLIGSELLDLVTSPLGDDQLARNASVAAQRPCDATRHAGPARQPRGQPPARSARWPPGSPPAARLEPPSSPSSRASSASADVAKHRAVLGAHA